jgi:hypothetical protein
MLADIPASDIPHSSKVKDLPVISSLPNPSSSHFVTNSILALFELAATQTPDPDLVRHIRQVVSVKRNTHMGFDQEKI